MKMVNHCHDPYEKESNLGNITVQYCSRLQDKEDQKEIAHINKPKCSFEQTEAIRLYCAAFPPLNKERDSPLQYYLPPPAWCGKSKSHSKLKMQNELPLIKDWISKNKKTAGKERRSSSYHNQKKKSKKRCKSFSRSFDCKENLPEWMTHEGVWDMEAQDTVNEFIRAIALDEGYSTCENTLTEEVKLKNSLKFIMPDNIVPDFDDNLNFDTDWVITEDLSQKVRSPIEEEMYAKFEAKFNHSIEALWSKDQNTPDDEYQELPIDFQELLASPSDHLFTDPSTKKYSFVSAADSAWSHNAATIIPAAEQADSSSKIIDGLQDCFKPLNITDAEVAPCDLEKSCYESGDLLGALTTVATTMSSFALLNHSRDRSAFVEIPPRLHCPVPPSPPPESTPEPAPTAALTPKMPTPEPEDLLTDPRTHFRPIHCAIEPEPRRYADGATFNISGELDDVEFLRSTSGSLYLFAPRERYLEYRSEHGIDYSRLNLTAAQRCPEMEEPGLRLRFPVRQYDVSVQTSCPVERPTPCVLLAPVAPPTPVAPAAPPFAPPASWSACEECARAAKKMRSSDIAEIWGEVGECSSCAAPVQRSAAAPAPDELSRDWEELVSAISAAHASYTAVDVDETLVSAERKRRHSAALRGGDYSCGSGGSSVEYKVGSGVNYSGGIDVDYVSGSGVNYSGGGGVEFSSGSGDGDAPPPPIGQCRHPHARFLHCYMLHLDRPLTR